MKNHIISGGAVFVFGLLIALGLSICSKYARWWTACL
jgi:hypothetical protein